MWTTIFVTHRDRRSFVETCLERSNALSIEVTVDAGDKHRVPRGCSCKQNRFERLLPNEESPCEWHFVSDLLAHPNNSKRIRVLHTNSSSRTHSPVLKLGASRFFSTAFPRLDTLTWDDDGMVCDNGLPAPHFPPNSRTRIFQERWDRTLSRVENLTSFTISSIVWWLDAEKLRQILSKNRSLASLGVFINIKGETEGPPVDLLNLKSLTVDCPVEGLSSVFRVPAFKRLSTLRISMEEEFAHSRTLRATGDQITLVANSRPSDIQENWESLTGYAQPVIRHVSVYDESPGSTIPHCTYESMGIGLMASARTVEIGLVYSGSRDDGFWEGLKHLGRGLKTMRFEIPGTLEPCGESSDDRSVWDKIAELVETRYKDGRPLSTLERMVVTKDEKANRLQDRAWEAFLEDRGIRSYLSVEQ